MYYEESEGGVYIKNKIFEQRNGKIKCIFEFI